MFADMCRYEIFWNGVNFKLLLPLNKPSIAVVEPLSTHTLPTLTVLCVKVSSSSPHYSSLVPLAHCFNMMAGYSAYHMGTVLIAATRVRFRPTVICCQSVAGG